MEISASKELNDTSFNPLMADSYCVVEDFDLLETSLYM